ncbi:hypothetical protein IV203_002262 [Nitzschia inconspicua]|uniref:Uncharacterized protein n=1 Tax=Nitzschia inconspicua TaxID=303405 RepID=A0A9K3L843_9STRA|nr:hypothetical protein IV203_002262 [Nitzschia inconspicua]
MSKIDPDMKQLKNLMLLDSQAPGHIFGNKEYLDDIRSSGNQTLTASTLKEKLFLNHIRNAPDNLGTAWYSDEVKTNIFILAELSKRFRIAYDSSKEDAIIVHHPKNKIKFVKNQNHMNLYVYDPNHQPIFTVPKIAIVELRILDRTGHATTQSSCKKNKRQWRKETTTLVSSNKLCARMRRRRSKVLNVHGLPSDKRMISVARDIPILLDPHTQERNAVEMSRNADQSSKHRGRRLVVEIAPRGINALVDRPF